MTDKAKVMSWDFQQIQQAATEEMKKISDHRGMESFRIKYLGRKGLLAQMYASLSSAPQEQKPSLGKQINGLRQFVGHLVEEKDKYLKEQQSEKAEKTLDVFLPGIVPADGQEHILTQTIGLICSLFEKLGFVIGEGPEIETEFNNFSALNIPVNHPSRDAFDTFYLDIPDPQNKNRNLLLRSHTSPAQIRIMKRYCPPIAVVIPGKVFRPDAVDASHCFMFHQIEGLLVDHKLKFSDLKGLLSVFCQRFFGDDIKMRFRPHFFPFTEPSAEVDISCYLCRQKGCSVCGRKGWLEIMGCGMVHPKVFEAVNYPAERYTGLAFGMGVERMAMLRYGIDDIRIFFENDLRFLRQF